MFSVLLVEDDHQDARLVNEFLARIPGAGGEGVSLTHASTLAQASAEMQDRAWDLVLLDLSLPDSCGLETLSAVRGLSQAPVVVLTGNGQAQVGVEAIAAGARGYLVKWDFDGTRLWQAMSDAISGAETDKALDARVLEAQRLESLGTLAGGVAHDFGNMMTVISGFAELIKLSASGPLEEYAERIQDVSHKASNLADQMLAYSRSDPASPSDLDLSRSVAGMRDLLEAAAGWRGAQVRFDLSEEPCLFAGTPSQIEQVLLNLVTNASEACSDTNARGEVRVMTDVIELRDTADYRTFSGAELPSGDYARLTVVDNGAGLAELQLQRIFDPSYTTKVQGRGLGLAVVASTIRRHGGGVRIATGESGTRFDLVFPALSEELKERDQGESSLEEGRSRVLHVEDEPMVQESTRLLLEALGVEVTTAESGARALEILGETPSEHFGLVLIDMTMPGISGYRLVSAIQALELQSKIVVTSGGGLPQAGRPAEPLPFLRKPYSLRDLKELLAELLQD